MFELFKSFHPLLLNHLDSDGLVRRLLKHIFWLVIAGLLIFFLYAVVVEFPLPSFGLALTMLVFTCAVLLLVQRLQTLALSVVWVVGLWLFMSLWAWFNGGVLSTGFSGYVVVVICAGLLLGRRAALLAAISSLSFGLLLVVADTQHWLPLSAPIKSGQVWLAQATYLILTVVLINFAMLVIQRLFRIGDQELAARQAANLALETSQTQIRSLIQDVDIGIMLHDAQGTVLLINQTALQLLGRSADDFERNPVIDLYSEDGRALAPEDSPVLTVLRSQQALRDVVVGFDQARTGQRMWVRVSVVPQFESSGAMRSVICSFTDVTSQRLLAADLRAERDLLYNVMNTSIAAITLVSATGEIVYANRSAEQILRLSKRQITARSYDSGEWRHTTVDGRPLPLADQPFVRVMQTQQAVVGMCHGIEWPNGERRILSINGAPIFDAHQQLTQIVFAFNDITEQLNTERALRQSEERYRLISETISDYVYTYRRDDDGRWLCDWITDAFTRLTGYSSAEVYEATGWESFVFPSDLPQLRASFERLLRNESPLISEFRLRSKEGKTIWVRHYDRAVWDADKQQVVRIYGAAQDLTKIKLLEQQLNQAQRMEAIGRLAGGIAHDFNNILTVIIGSSGFVLEDLPADSPLRLDVEQIASAAQRAATLTGQLLAFSRQQVLQPQVVNLNQILATMQPMLRRLIGEHIELIFRHDPDLGWVKVDPTQIEQVIMNLAINARDAMPQGGLLTIETANVRVTPTSPEPLAAGPYVQLTVRDTGLGMEPEVCARVFEPFFSTKLEQKGTGLGLATVHGIVTQSKGYIAVSSQPKQGSTFTVWLPQITAPLHDTQPEVLQLPVHAAGTDQVVLLVEDEPSVREIINRVLLDQGFQVVLADNGQHALQVLKQHFAAINLLVTDVVMPGGISGQELAERVLEQRPDIKVLYLSGYTDSALLERGVTEPTAQTAFLHKPFTAIELSQAIWRLLYSEVA